MQTYPLGLLVSCGPTGLLASPLPFFAAPSEGANGVLRAHIAKGNPHWQALQDAEECLVVFRGPDAYVAPGWYPSKKVTQKAVPTWNYAMVQAWGKPRIIGDMEWIRRQAAEITRFEEGKRAHPWTLEDAPADYMESMLKAIVGLEITISRLEGKWKMSQNREAGDVQGVINGMRDGNDPHRNEAVAAIIESRRK